MRIAVIGGAGAMGGLFGAWLSRGGADVILLDVARSAIEAINAKGLIVEEKDGSTTVQPMKATDRASDIGEVDLVINFVKCYYTDDAIRSAFPVIGSRTTVLTLQNGWGNGDQIGKLVGSEKVLAGITYHSGTLVGPGHVRHTAAGPTIIGEVSGRSSSRLEQIATAFRSGDIEVQISETILNDVWKKLSLNACANPPSALLRCVAEELVSMPASRELMGLILREVVAVANAKGIPLEYEERLEAIKAGLVRAGRAKASMLQDVEAGRRTEIDVISGAISAAGRETGIPTPVNDTILRIVQALETTYLAPEAR